MLSEPIGVLLKSARKRLKISREDLAQRGGVSTRLLAELERGERPNVSLESTLKLLHAVGVSVRLTTAYGAVVEIRDASAVAMERAARAAQRRSTWTGRRVHLHAEGDDPRPGRSSATRITAVTRVSKQAFGIASVARGQVAPVSARKSSSSKRRPVAGSPAAQPRSQR